MAEVATPHTFDWAHDAYVALNDPSKDHNQAHDDWSPFSAPPTPLHNLSFAIPPSLLTQTSMERYGQITPPEELPPAQPRRKVTQQSSTSVDPLTKDTVWPASPTQQQSKHAQSPSQEESSPKRRRTSRQASANQTILTPPLEADTDANPQPPKRKRGRPKSQPQMVETFMADGFPFQVSSARQSHLEKNRVAAHKCRQRKKEYINGLEGRARDFSSKNKALKENVAILREEVLSLKNEVLRHAGCGFWAVDEYLARCAGDLLGMEVPTALASPSSHTPSPTISTHQLQDESISPLESSPDMSEFGGLELLRDFDEADMNEAEAMLR